MSAANMYLAETAAESLFFADDTALTPDTHTLVERVLWAADRTLDVALLPRSEEVRVHLSRSRTTAWRD